MIVYIEIYGKGGYIQVKKYDYKAKMKQNRRRYAKRIAGIAVATTVVLSAPVAPNVLSSTAFHDAIGTNVVHAASDNIVDFGEEKEQSITDYSTTSKAYIWGIHMEFPNVEDYNDIRMTY